MSSEECVIEVDSEKEDGSAITGSESEVAGEGFFVLKAGELGHSATNGGNSRNCDAAQSKTSSENSMASLPTEYENGAIVWVRIKGHPWWPGIVIAISDVPWGNRKVIPLLPPADFAVQF
jgi:hypothetical protein